jgi:hypothetical protein
MANGHKTEATSSNDVVPVAKETQHEVKEASERLPSERGIQTPNLPSVLAAPSGQSNVVYT